MTPAGSRPRLPRKRQGSAEELPCALEWIGEGRCLAALAVFRAIGMKIEGLGVGSSSPPFPICLRGLTDFLSVLDAQRNLFVAQVSLVQSEVTAEKELLGSWWS